jgi:hypothetical protein
MHMTPWLVMSDSLVIVIIQIIACFVIVWKSVVWP